jgi:hypothetical protein
LKRAIISLFSTELSTYRSMPRCDRYVPQSACSFCYPQEAGEKSMNIARHRLFICLTLTLLFSPAYLFAAQPLKSGPPAPLPPQLAAARKIFIANAPGRLPSWVNSTPDRTYNEFYAGLKNGSHYELAPTPADADLIFELSSADFVTGVSGASNTGCSSSSSSELRLVVFDTKTRTPLWWFTEPIEYRRHIDDPYEDAMKRLLDDVKKLSGEAAAPVEGPKK